MKKFNFALVLSVFVLAHGQVEPETTEYEYQMMFEAIKKLLRDHFVPNEPKVDFYYSGNSSEDLAEFLLQANLDLSVTVTRFDVVQKVQINFPSVLLFDSMTHYWNAAKKITWTSKNDLWLNQLIYVLNLGDADPIEEFSKIGHFVENQSIIKYISDVTIDLITGFRFSPGVCGYLRHKTINQFSNETLTWHNKTFFPEKYQNFHGCPLKVAFVAKTSTVTSRAIFMFLAQKLNFQMVRVEVATFDSTTEKFDTSESLTFQSILVYKFYVFSSPLFSDYLTFSVPAGKPYSQLEKMFLTFDKNTWVAIGVVLAIAFLAVWIINFMPLHVQNFVYGRNVKTAMLNLADIFLNGGQNREPGRNFARYLLMMFITWTLIIRTCYQSELYRNLQLDLRKPRIRSIEELNEQNFTLIYEPNSELFLGEMVYNRSVLLQPPIVF